MEFEHALDALRADVCPANIRSGATAESREAVREELEQLADELERRPDQTLAAFKAAWILMPRADAFKTACASLACMFGAPTHAADGTPYTAVLRESGALGPVVHAAGRFTPFWSCACEPDGSLLLELEAMLTAGVIEECRAAGQERCLEGL